MDSLGLAQLSSLFFFFSSLIVYSSGIEWVLLWMDLGVDYLSISLLALSCLIISLAILSGLEKACNEMVWACSFLMVALALSFFSPNFLVFYCGFELSMVPMVYIILRWGSEAVRLVAGGYMVFYTLFSSMPLLWAIACLSYKTGDVSMFLLNKTPFGGMMGGLWWVCLILAFLVKSPVYPFHLWLPKAHVEAPTFGSMILAGIMLKLGTYGLFRVFPLYGSGHSIINFLVISLGIWGAIYSSIICLRLVDMKEVIAYASVGHMGLVVSGIFSYNSWGFHGAYMMMLSHGLISSLLFALVGFMSDLSGSRGFIFNRGWMNVRPFLSVFMFMGCSANMGVPPFPSFIAEIGLMGGLGSMNYINFLLMGVASVLTGAYSLRLYLLTQHGSSPSHLLPVKKVNNGPVFLSMSMHCVFMGLLNFVWMF
uniref:NADH-ubiquinone oxidoreductase chain 4 n=1 Tax=Lingula anatina TaxID=7574 RepID=Q5W902_LINAN|nr:NADH dehydrogenase subunit 4 [Lingula anatina]